MINGRRVSVVIPAFRVAEQIGTVLDAMPEGVDRVFVVDDASPDGVKEVVERRKDPRVVVVRHDTNQGVGGATVTGFQAALAAGCDIVVKCDGDGQMDPRDIPRLVAPVVDGSADYAKGSRFHHVRELGQMPVLRFVGNIGLTFLTKMASGYWNVLDPVNGFVAVRSGVLEKIPLGKLARRYFFETDLLIRLNIVEARVADVPLPARYGSEQSSLSLSRAFLSFPPLLVAGLLKRVFWRYLFYDVSPVAIFGGLGALLIGAGVAGGLYHWTRTALTGRPTPLGTIMLVALPLILGSQLVIQAIVLDIQNTPRPSRGPERLRYGPEPGDARREQDG